MPDLPPPPQADAPWRVVGAALVARVGEARVVAAGVVVAVVLVAVAAGAAVRARGSPAPPDVALPTAESSPAGPAHAPAGSGGGAGSGSSADATSTTAEVVAQAAGAVVHPGVYRLPPRSRIADLVQAAGGPGEAADLDRVNLAAVVEDGTRVYVPRLGEVVPPGLLSASAGGEAGGTGPGLGGVPVPLDLNAATLDQLDRLTGIGPATAQAILDERRRRGRFRSVDDLLEVRGIGPAKLAAIRDQVRV